MLHFAVLPDTAGYCSSRYGWRSVARVPLRARPSAWQAGLLAGDKIIKVDDVFTGDMTVDEAVRLIRGPKGEEVVLTIFRVGLGQL